MSSGTEVPAATACYIDESYFQGMGMELKDKKVLVIGLGRTGASVSRFLVEKGASVEASDLRSEEDIACVDELKELGVRVESGGHALRPCASIDLIVVSPGVPKDLPILSCAMSLGIEVIGELELAARFIKEPIIAIAGTNGKTTTTTLLSEVLEKGGFSVFTGGNIGTPAIEYVRGGPEKRAELLVLEVSSFQLEWIKHFRAEVAILLNITEDHLDRYASFDDYADTKFEIFANQVAGDTAIINAADPVIAARLFAGSLKSKVIAFKSTGIKCEESDLYLDGSDIVLRIDGKDEIYKPPSGGGGWSTSVDNVMAVIAAGRRYGVDRECIVDILRGFKGLPHRMEFAGESEGVKFINDSKATNIGALSKALSTLEGPVVLLAGGVDKGGDYGMLLEEIRDKVRLLVLFGEAAEKIKDALSSGVTELVMARGLREAFEEALKLTKPGDTVLLSPACSSFDEFKNYEERGRFFKELVRAL